MIEKKCQHVTLIVIETKNKTESVTVKTVSLIKNSNKLNY